MNLIVVISILFSLATFIPLHKSKHWFVRDLDFPRLQILLINLILFFIIIISAEKSTAIVILLIVMLLGILIDFYRIFNYLPISKRSVKSSNKTDLKIISANVRTKNDKYNLLTNLIKNEEPDILLLIEVDQKWIDSVKTDLNKLFVHSIIQPQDNTYGLALYSKFKIEDHEVLFRVDKDVPSLKVKIKDSNWGEFIIYGMHPRPPRPSEAHSTQRDAELMQVADEISKSKTPSLVIGDLNDVAWSHTTRLFTRVSGLLDPRHGRGFYNSFPSFFPLIGFPLDHVFLSPYFDLYSFSILESIGSDHRPLKLELSYRTYPNLKEKTETTLKDNIEKQENIKKGKEWDEPISEVDPDE